jgi:hypothetical protein
VEIVDPPRVEERPEVPYLGIREVTPFRGMVKRSDELLVQARRALAETGVVPVGFGFVRLHVVDMNGPMDIDVGFVTERVLDGPLAPGSFPAGRYATLTFRGSGIQGNRALLDWANEQGLELDRHETPDGDAFACRYEAFWTDPKAERRKKQWSVEVAIKLR